MGFLYSFWRIQRHTLEFYEYTDWLASWTSPAEGSRLWVVFSVLLMTKSRAIHHTATDFRPFLLNLSFFHIYRWETTACYYGSSTLSTSRFHRFFNNALKHTWVILYTLCKEYRFPGSGAFDVSSLLKLIVASMSTAICFNVLSRQNVLVSHHRTDCILLGKPPSCYNAFFHSYHIYIYIYIDFW